MQKIHSVALGITLIFTAGKLDMPREDEVRKAITNACAGMATASMRKDNKAWFSRIAPGIFRSGPDRHHLFAGPAT